MVKLFSTVDLEAEIVSKSGVSVNPKSALALLTFGAEKGDQLVVVIEDKSEADEVIAKMFEMTDGEEKVFERLGVSGEERLDKEEESSEESVERVDIANPLYLIDKYLDEDMRVNPENIKRLGKEVEPGTPT